MSEYLWTKWLEIKFTKSQKWFVRLLKSLIYVLQRAELDEASVSTTSFLMSQLQQKSLSILFC